MARKGRWIVTLMALLLMATGANAASVFSDDFESRPLGGAPDASKWTPYAGGGSTSLTIADDVPAAQGSKSLKVVGTNNVKNIGIDSATSTLYTTMYVSAMVRIDTDTTATNGACLDLMNGGNIASALRLMPKGSGKYDAKVISKTADGLNTKWDTVASNLAIGSWETWVFGIQITNSTTGEGTYDVYRNGVQLASNVAYRPFSALTNSVHKLRIWGDHNYFHVDNILLFNSVITGTTPGVLMGQVSLANYSGSKELTPVQIDARLNGSLVKSLVTNLDASGNYSVASGLAEGTYELTYKACCWLSQAVPNVQISASVGTSPINVTLSTGGDLDGNNTLNGSDLEILLANLE